jgi:hypothetical protein
VAPLGASAIPPWARRTSGSTSRCHYEPGAASRRRFHCGGAHGRSPALPRPEWGGVTSGAPPPLPPPRRQWYNPAHQRDRDCCPVVKRSPSGNGCENGHEEAEQRSWLRLAGCSGSGSRCVVGDVDSSVPSLVPKQCIWDCWGTAGRSPPAARHWRCSLICPDQGATADTGRGRKRRNAASHGIAKTSGKMPLKAGAGGAQSSWQRDRKGGIQRQEEEGTPPSPPVLWK